MKTNDELGALEEGIRGAWSLLVPKGRIAVIVLAIGANFVSRHEAQLTAEAERALPGPLK